MGKGHNFWQMKDHNSGRRHENQINYSICFICLSNSNCLGNSFLHLKIVNIHFDGVLPLTHSGLQMPEFGRWKLWHIEESKTPDFTLVENKLQNFQSNLMAYFSYKSFIKIEKWSLAYTVPCRYDTEGNTTPTISIYFSYLVF